MNEVTTATNSVAEVYSIEVKLQITVLKPIHARWLISLCDHCST